MPLWEALVLGLVQGLTEFLPVSSSGHLTLVQHLMGLRGQGSLAFDVLLHLGTFLAVLLYFARDVAALVAGFFGGLAALPARRKTWTTLWREADFRTAVLILVGSVPSGLMGLLLQPFFESLYDSLVAVAVGWLITAVLLWQVDRLGHRGRRAGESGAGAALWTGFMQGVAIAPGISRSGATVAGALMAGMGRYEAARFSFLLALPAILGAALVELRHVGGFAGSAPLAAGFAAATLSGMVAIRWLIQALTRGSLKPFALYCALLGAAVLAWQVL
ncbi:MAG: undecaprenyl-diphosphate phosphatase [Clostridia bacterium]|nr:undecaprenyl-diphosphate phosphatase [Clostridia bacterium]